MGWAKSLKEKVKVSNRTGKVKYVYAAIALFDNQGAGHGNRHLGIVGVCARRLIRTEKEGPGEPRFLERNEIRDSIRTDFAKDLFTRTKLGRIP